MKCAVGFVAGFTALFMAMGALAGTVGSFFTQYRTALNIVCGAVVIFFGLSYLGVFKLTLFRGFSGMKGDMGGFWKAAAFGVIFSVGWTPCVGAFLGSALMLVAQQGRTAEGMIMLLLYSLGLGIPFLLSALLIDYLKGTFNAIKRHYRVINIVCGCFLILIGILMATGVMWRFLNLLI